MKNKSKNKSYLLCELDKRYGLYASSNSFTIKEKVKDNSETGYSWVARYHYSALADALRGYVKHQLRSRKTAKKVNGDIQTLINHVVDLHDYLQKFGTDLEKDIMNRLKDPVELRLAQNAMDISNGD